jgi:hypothetical protein
MNNAESMQHFPGEKPHDLGSELQTSVELQEEILMLEQELADPELDPAEAESKRALLSTLKEARGISDTESPNGQAN